MSPRRQLSSSKLIMFPNLHRGNHKVTSDETDSYNCIAWAAGDSARWWDPTPGFYWPPGILRDASTSDSFVEAFQTLGYIQCADGVLEAGFEKVAIYVLQGLPTHAALQLPGGKWTSKCGGWEDIQHDTEFDMEGSCADCYGKVAIYMRRPYAT